jgi:hypothetical protein
VSEQLTVNGVDLASYAYMTSDISSLLRVPDRRGDNVAVPGRHGVIRTLGKRFDANEIVLPMWLVGAQADGSIPDGSTEQLEFFKRRDELLRLFYADVVELEFTRDGNTVTTRVEVADVLDFTRRHAEPLAQVNVALTLLDAFWRDVDPVQQTITGATGTVASLTAFAGATAPMSDLQITFTGPVNNPKLIHGNRTLQYNGVISTGRELLLDVANWDVDDGAGMGWTPNVLQVYGSEPGVWLELDPTLSPFQVRFEHAGGGSASVEIAGYRAFLSP